MYSILEYKESTVVLQDDTTMEIIEVSYDDAEIYVNYPKG